MNIIFICVDNNASAHVNLCVFDSNQQINKRMFEFQNSDWILDEDPLR